jgi:fatty acid desaturase
MATVAEMPARTMQDPALKEHLQRLRKVENWRNALAIIRTWVFLAVVIGGAIAFDQWRTAQGLHWTWDIPVFFVAILCVGAGQHQLTALGHEGSHHVLFTNRLVNELASDWFCMYPCFTTTHHYRLQHLAHHQFVNDPDRDPNFGQLLVNGHWTHFPMTKKEFWIELVQQFLPWNLVNYLRVTAMYNSMPTDKNPYIRPDGRASSTARKAGLLYFFAQIVLVVWLTLRGDATLLFTVVGGLWAAAMIFYLTIPNHWYMRSRIIPTISMRWVTVMRLTFITGFFLTIAMLSLKFGPRVLAYTGLLWALPFFTSFSFFMMMRQLVQHSNADRGWLTNTRIFLVHKFFRDSVLPYGQDYHLPHHLYATVPHYNLKELHHILMEYPEYRDQAQIVAGAVIPKDDHHYPTIVEMLGPEHTPLMRHQAFIDNSVLDNCEVKEKDEILKAGEQSVREDSLV